jgi:signal-transduction protein with cAMP-binding, CBS, and nucleotidyltransferase domain
MRLAHHVMRPAVCVPADASIDDVRIALDEQGLAAIAVIDDEGHYVGLITAADLDEAGEPSSGCTASALAGNTIRPISHSDYLSSALTHLTVHGLDGLPVVEHRVVVGHLHRADIAAEHHRHVTALETRQAGWIRIVRHGSPTRPERRRLARRTTHRTATVTTAYRSEQPEDTLRRLRATGTDSDATKVGPSN